MFFIGIFGVEVKSKEIMDINNITCHKCMRLGVYKLVKEYSYFHFFFIPLFKWGVKYYLISRCCNTIFEISNDKGNKLETGVETVIEDKELSYNINNNCSPMHHCFECGNPIETPFHFCPNCGKKL
ncbi:zinc-ribbon domain-containing protein [Alkalibaculum sp. M08DMB]|uniref:Zinc-ribbon domain-containing protein n=1 Tax=Alkalibaculum sporogenes TaxID=2655001 RepID=A0A6A7K4B4_9FIRM|nr:zinc ribbon domain-containing protein [Alkalibaculum sporogenes]MPW24289.1 zinc-ribbon domain-containing protein [Alkalibaculum sporogenes]